MHCPQVLSIFLSGCIRLTSALYIESTRISHSSLPYLETSTWTLGDDGETPKERRTADGNVRNRPRDRKDRVGPNSVSREVAIFMTTSIETSASQGHVAGRYKPSDITIAVSTHIPASPKPTWRASQRKLYAQKIEPSINRAD